MPNPNPQRQPVHSDADFAHPTHPFALVINVPLIDFTPENGSTELWLGTHTGSLSGLQVQEGAHGDRASGRIKESLLDERRKIRAPSQPDVRKGSIVVRDLRLWHAGMPNLTDEVRVMLALIHFAPWYRNPMRLELSEGLRGWWRRRKGLRCLLIGLGRRRRWRGILGGGLGIVMILGRLSRVVLFQISWTRYLELM